MWSGETEGIIYIAFLSYIKGFLIHCQYPCGHKLFVTFGLVGHFLKGSKYTIALTYNVSKYTMILKP